MKVEQDLRIVIKAAAAASKNQDRLKSTRVLIEDWLKKNPSKAAKARQLVKQMVAAEAAESKARDELERKFGLGRSAWSGNGEFLLADEAAFKKAGGDTGVKLERFSEERVIAEYAAAKTKQAAEKVLERYGIVWK
jgi:hypothetical protein